MFVPENEQGVIAAFMMRAESAGWNIKEIGTAFPDAVFEYMGEEWKIEFEFNSINFLTHKHDHRGCDAIVCFANDYRNCPLPVICLSDDTWPEKFYTKSRPETLEIEYWKQRAYRAENKLGRINNEIDNAHEMQDEKLVLWESAKTILIDFAKQVYDSIGSETPLIKAHGMFCKGVSLPWTKRGEYMNQFGIPSAVRKMMLTIIMETTPQVFIYNGVTKTWQANIVEYANQFEMVDAINDAFSKIVGDVDAVIVGDEEEA